MDGTLYRQNHLRFRMAISLLIHFITTSRGARDVRVLRHFRQNREYLADIGADNVAKIQYESTAKLYQVSESTVEKIVQKWMLQKPLALLRQSRFKDVELVFSELKSRGIKIGIYSDYPVLEKLNALGLHADAHCCSTDKDVNRYKPAPDGFIKILNKLGLNYSDCLIIGDSLKRDGACAKKLKMPFLLCKGAHFYTDLFLKLHRA